jgi:hypothetical protein
MPVDLRFPTSPEAAWALAVIHRFQTKEEVTLRASVGSTEASNGRLARVGVVGPKRATTRQK